MLTPTLLTFIALALIAVVFASRFFGTLKYQVLGPDNSWVAEVHSRSDAVQLKNKGYQVFKEINKNGFVYFKQI